MSARTAVGIDVGGTKILGAVVSGDGQILQRQVRPTPSDPGELLEALTQVGEDLSAEVPDGTPVGVGYPALVTRDGVARYGPNISTLELRLRDVMQRALHVDVVVDNDATCATWAEFTIGAGAGTVRDMVMFTLGTGIGGGLVIDGSIVRGAHGFAGELGHLIIDVHGRRGRSEIQGEIEAYSSGSAFVSLIGEAVQRGDFAGTPLADVGHPTPAQVEAAAAEGVEPAMRLTDFMGRSLGVAMATMVNALDPELIVVGGGAAKGGDLILNPARQALREHTLGHAHRPEVPVVPARLGPDAGVIGAALLSLQGR